MSAESRSRSSLCHNAAWLISGLGAKRPPLISRIMSTFGFSSCFVRSWLFLLRRRWFSLPSPLSARQITLVIYLSCFFAPARALARRVFELLLYALSEIALTCCFATVSAFQPSPPPAGFFLVVCSALPSHLASRLLITVRKTN